MRVLRTGQGKGLAEIATATGLSKGYLSELENAVDANPTLDVLQRIAKALDVTIADLLGASKVMPTAPDPRMLEDAPEGLLQFAKARKAEGLPLAASELIWLATAQYRGKRPQTKEDFAYLHRSLRSSTERDDDAHGEK
jgi:transcriptional regulator with XRE-family HTH domain